MEMNFCRRCGSKLVQHSTGFYECENKHKIFHNPVPTASVIFVDPDNRVTLGIRGIEPYKGTLDSIGGFMDLDETVEEALAREILEETGLTPDQYSTPTYLTSSTAPYPYGGEEITIFSMIYLARLKPDAKIDPQDDVSGVVIRDIPGVNLSEIGAEDIRDAMRVLKDLDIKGALNELHPR